MKQTHARKITIATLFSSSALDIYNNASEETPRRGVGRKGASCIHLYMKTKHLPTHAHTHMHARTAPPTAQAPPSSVCIAPKRAASFPRQFFTIQAKETQQHPATSYSHLPLLRFRRVAPFKKNNTTKVFLCHQGYALSICIRAILFCKWHRCMFTAALCTYAAGIMWLRGEGGERGYCGSMR